ncbi:hypothetical protein CISIN_1g042517mg [Citrus sinensis]|uniref:Non-haem dioxygenase N-terminal domain-containing protein n=1 Tax=Citrus sinensis TaxID=2711 RepID=A0A067G944_CITSI|nr:hypothetical protein CISIN_1g042517mg [Citrus sinensis]
MGEFRNIIPTVDRSPFFISTEDNQDGKKMYGFFQIVNRGIPQKLFSQAIELSKTFYGYSDDEKKLFNSSLRSGAPLQVLKEVFSRLKGTGLLIESILNECLCLPTNFLKIYNNDRSWDFMAALHYFPATECENNGIIVSTLYNWVKPLSQFTQEYGGFLYKDYQES